MTQHPPNEIRAGGGLYYGPTSVAYLFIVLQTLYADLLIEGIQLGTWSAAYLKQAQDHIKSFPGPRVGKCGIADDILALLAIGAASSKDPDMAAELCDYSAEVTDPESENEWLYGRAGYLYYLRLVKASFIDDDKTTRMLNDTQIDVIETMLDSPRPWKWHGKAYVGAVHGTIGIITQIVLTDPERWAPAVEAELAVILSYQYDSGNWPSSIPPGKDRLVQVCHGAPGVVICLNSIKHHFPNLRDKIEHAIRRGRQCIIERGLLTKESCLCHGKHSPTRRVLFLRLTTYRHLGQRARSRGQGVRAFPDLHHRSRDEVYGEGRHDGAIGGTGVAVVRRGWESMDVGGHGQGTAQAIAGLQ